MNGLPALIAVVGTNASGKSALGVELARLYGGEVVSADSRQVYRGLDLGSGKITRTEMKGVPHHLIDVCRPGEFFSMADFQRQAFREIDGILERGKLPFLVGGTGLYVASVTDGYELSDKAPDLRYRAELEKLETPALYGLLKQRLPDTDIDPKNRNRVMRALERLKADDYHPGRKRPRYNALKLGVTWERETLKKRIDERLAKRLSQGMIEEVRDLMAGGVGTEFLMKLGLEYRYICQYLLGETALEQMTLDLSSAIKKFAKRQMTWFRRDPDIVWLDMEGQPVAQGKKLIDEFLSKNH